MAGWGPIGHDEVIDDGSDADRGLGQLDRPFLGSRVQRGASQDRRAVGSDLDFNC